MSYLARIKGLRRFGLSSATQVTDKGMKALATLPELETLWIGGTKDVTDEGVKSLLRCPTLTGLSVYRTSVTEAGIRAFLSDRGQKVKILGFSGLPVKDEFIAFVTSAAPNLELLCLRENKGITDRSIDHLARLTRLLKLDAYGTSITPAGIKTLQERLPECRIQGPAPSRKK